MTVERADDSAPGASRVAKRLCEGGEDLLDDYVLTGLHGIVALGCSEEGVFEAEAVELRDPLGGVCLLLDNSTTN